MEALHFVHCNKSPQTFSGVNFTSCFSILKTVLHAHCRYQRGRFYRGWGVCIGMVILVTFIILLSVSLSVRYHDYDSNSDNAFAAGDTRILSYSSSFCDGLTLTGDDSATLYLLRSTPPLSGPTNIFSTKFEPSNPPDSYKYLYYYLYPGSKMEMTYCLSGSSGWSGFFTFALIKGKSNFNDWEDDGSSSHTLKQFTVESQCPSSKSFYYNFTSEDTYYFVFDNLGPNTFSLDASLVLNRTEYLPNEVSVYDSCDISFVDDCSVSVPYQSDYVALLEVSSQSVVGPDSNLYYNWSCNPRVWIYVLIVFLPLLFVVVTTLVVLTVCIIYVRKRSQKYTTLPTVATETTADTVDATVTTTTVTTTPTAPPPVNPAYPPTYGSTEATANVDNPPPYPINDYKK